MELLPTKNVLEIVNYLVVIAGVLYALVTYPRNQRKREAAERDSFYVALNDHFLRFLELQLAHPGLGTSATDRTRIWDGLDTADRTRQRIQFDYLASLLERAHGFLCTGPAAQTEWAKAQWETWKHWLERYSQNPNFVAFWQHLDDCGDKASYGADFLALIDDKLRHPAAAS